VIVYYCCFDCFLEYLFFKNNIFINFKILFFNINISKQLKKLILKNSNSFKKTWCNTKYHLNIVEKYLSGCILALKVFGNVGQSVFFKNLIFFLLIFFVYFK